MHGILGSDLKAALHTALSKQLAAGIHRLGEVKLGTVHVSFSGVTAFATRKVTRQWTNTGWAYVAIAFVNYPYLSDKAILSRVQADIVTGYTLHEGGHILFSDFEAIRERVLNHPRPNALKAWANGFEDPRMERDVIVSGIAPGAIAAFSLLESYLLVRALNASTDFTSTRNGPAVIAMFGRDVLGYSVPEFARIKASLPAKWVEFYTRWARKIVDMRTGFPGTTDAFDAAEALMDELKKSAPKERGHERGPGRTPEREDNYSEQEDSGETPEAGDDPDELEDDGSLDEEESGAGPTDESSTDDEDDEGDDADEDKDEDEDAEGEGGDKDAEDESTDDESEGDSEDAGSGDKNDDQSEEDGSGTGSGADEEDDPASPEPDMQEMFDSANRRARDAIEPAVIPGTPNPEEVDSSAPVLPHERQRAAEVVKPLVPGLAVRMAQMLRAPEATGWDGGYESGRFNRRRTAQLLCGSPTVFSRRWEQEGIDTAVYLLVDGSGSMGRAGMDSAMAAAYKVADVAEKANAWCTVQVFDGSTHQEQMEDRDGKRYFAPTLVNLRVMKEPHERLSKVKYRFPRADARSGTPDLAAITMAVQKLSTLPHKQKFLFVLTDGRGDYPAQLHAFVTDAEKRGIITVGFGIGVDCSGCYPRALRVSRQSIDEAVINELRKLLDAARMRRTR